MLEPLFYQLFATHGQKAEFCNTETHPAIGYHGWPCQVQVGQLNSMGQQNNATSKSGQ